MRLSVIVPVYNEAATVVHILRRLIKVRSVQEIIVVDDGSTDQTPKKIHSVRHSKIKSYRKKNGGKGSAIQLGLKKVTGDYVLIQDADLEYDPEDIPALLDPILKKKAQVVYGSRFLGPHTNLLYWHRKGNDFINFLVNLLYNTTLSDLETCYKVLPTKLFRELQLTANRFDFEPEITCKLLLRGVRIYEVPISYSGRDFNQGKKITWRDGISAVGVVFKFRVKNWLNWY